jgi:ABC-type transporter Mla MlaB component
MTRPRGRVIVQCEMAPRAPAPSRTRVDAQPTVVRAGEHACLRTASGEAHDRLTAAFVASALARGDKVVQLREGRDGAAVGDAELGAAFASASTGGQLEIADARAVLLARGAFDPDRVLEWLRTEHAVALGQGWSGMSVTVDMAAVSGAPGGERLAEYERRLDRELASGTLALLCHYDLRRFSRSMHAHAGRLHHVDIPPELAGIGRTGPLAAAVQRAGSAVRLAGELDVDTANPIGDVLLAHFHGALELDVADVSYADVIGMRALRGPVGRKLTITGASPSTLPLMRLLAWDSDPTVEIR